MNATTTQTIYIIRHGEKPTDPVDSPNPNQPPTFGIDVDGNANKHSLIPAGWQRAGALVQLFAPYDGQFRAGIATPTNLYSPDYPAPGPTGRRTHETIYPLSLQLAQFINTPYPEGDEKQLAQMITAQAAGITLICWEHGHIPDIANNIPTVPGTQIPQQWDGTRFDVIWSFVLGPGGKYVFSQIPQMLLYGDQNSGIPATSGAESLSSTPAG